jgi:hypothetical protein
MEMKDADTTIHVGGVQVYHEEMKKVFYSIEIILFVSLFSLLGRECVSARHQDYALFTFGWHFLIFQDLGRSKGKSQQ